MNTKRRISTSLLRGYLDLLIISSYSIFFRFDSVRLELDDINDVFELVKNSVEGTAAEPFFLSVLQHLLCIRDDFQVRPAYFKLVEECVSQIVLHKSGCDPDFR